MAQSRSRAKVGGKEVIITRNWSFDDVRKMCIENQLYTYGVQYDYDSLMKFIISKEPTYTNVYKAAEDILCHSDPKQRIENIMFLLENFVVRTYFGFPNSEQ